MSLLHTATGAVNLLADATVKTSNNPAQLIIAAIVGIVAIILLITILKIHPFLALMFGSVIMAIVAGEPITNTFDSFTTGLGTTIGNVGVLIVLGSMIGTLLIRSGAADQIVDTILDKMSEHKLPWAMALIAFVMGIPLFFEVGVVLLIPIVLMVARRTGKSIVLVGIPALAGLIGLHCFVPPHPGPLIAIDAIGANMGYTLAIGLLIAIPAVAIAGPILGPIMAKHVQPIGQTFLDVENDRQQPIAEADRPAFGKSISVALLPVALMLIKAVFEMFGWKVPVLTSAVNFFGEAVVALTTAVVYGAIVLGLRRNLNLKQVNGMLGTAIKPIAEITFIVGAGGGFKQTLTDSGIADVIGHWMHGLPVSPLIAAWLLAVLLRIAVGSATVATITASGIVAPLVAGGSPLMLALTVLAVGAGSVACSHVNDAGFWIVKEYFGMTIGETAKTWTIMCTVISIVGILCIMPISLLA